MSDVDAQLHADETIARHTAEARAFSAACEKCVRALNALPTDAPLRRLHTAVIALANAGRESNIPAQRLVAELKEVVFHLPQFTVRLAAERGEMMRDLVTRAMNAYHRRTDD